MNPLQRAIALLVKRHGSLRAAGRVLRIDHTYLFKLASGEKVNPSDAVLKKLNLRKRVVFETIRERKL